VGRVLVATIARALLLAIATSASAQDEEVFSFDTGPGPEGEPSSFLDSLRLDVDIIGRYEASREYGRPEWLFAVGLDIHKVFSDAEGDIAPDGSIRYVWVTGDMGAQTPDVMTACAGEIRTVLSSNGMTADERVVQGE